MRTLKVQPGTKNNKAGWGWSKIIITKNVVIIPKQYPPKQAWKYGVVILENSSPTLCNYLSISYFRLNPTNIPGITISPNPSIENL